MRKAPMLLLLGEILVATCIVGGLGGSGSAFAKRPRSSARSSERSIPPLPVGPSPDQSSAIVDHVREQTQPPPFDANTPPAMDPTEVRLSVFPIDEDRATAADQRQVADESNTDIGLLPGTGSSSVKKISPTGKDVPSGDKAIPPPQPAPQPLPLLPPPPQSVGVASSKH